MTVLLIASPFEKAANSPPVVTAMTVLVNQANDQTFYPVGGFQHYRQANYHGRYTERSRHREQNEANDKNGYSNAEQNSALEHSDIVLFENIQWIGWGVTIDENANISSV